MSLLLGILPAVAASGHSETSVVVPTAAPLPMQHPAQDGAFYLLALLEQDPAVRSALAKDAAFLAFQKNQHSSLETLTSELNQSASNYIQPFVFSPATISAFAEELRQIYRTNAALRTLVAGPLRQSGAYELWSAQSDEDLLVNAWTLCARGLNGILTTYGLGQVPLYPKIDSLTANVTDPSYGEVLHQLAWTVAARHTPDELAFAPSLQAALLLLQVNHRDEATRLLPLESGENAAALARLPTVDWSQYRYSVVLIPGIGPETRGTALSAMGWLHVVEAARRFHEKSAPFLLLSGGFVHPAQTPYSEALEMKRALIEHFGVPADAILIDPQARHTTTNLRNAARMLYRDGLPFDKPALITGDLYQSLYIESATFQQRCLRELGYSPFLDLHPVSPIDIEWRPNRQSLQQNPIDPLDP